MKNIKSLWQSSLNLNWLKSSIGWIQGLGSADKNETHLDQTDSVSIQKFKDDDYCNCELQSVQQELHNPEVLLENSKNQMLKLGGIRHLH